MTNLSDIINVLPCMKSGDDLIAALELLPEYNPEISNTNASVRLMALSDLYRVYIPSQMSLEIYSKLYLALLPLCRRRERSWRYSSRTRTTEPLCSRNIAASWADLIALPLSARLE